MSSKVISQTTEILLDSFCETIKKIRTTFHEPLCDFVLFLETLGIDIDELDTSLFKHREFSFTTIDEAMAFTEKNISQCLHWELYKDRFTIYWTFLKCIQSSNVYAKVCASQSQLPEIYKIIIQMVIKYKEGEPKRKLCTEINMEYLKYIYRLDGEKYKKAHKNIRKLFRELDNKVGLFRDH